MPLSEHEQRVLEQMEHAMEAEDPKFATAMRGRTPKARQRRRIMLGSIGVVVGLVLVVLGVAQGVVALAVAGFVLMLGAGALALTPAAQAGGQGRGRKAQRPARCRRPPTAAPSPASSGPPRAAARSCSASSSAGTTARTRARAGSPPPGHTSSAPRRSAFGPGAGSQPSAAAAAVTARLPLVQPRLAQPVRRPRDPLVPATDERGPAGVRPCRSATSPSAGRAGPAAAASAVASPRRPARRSGRPRAGPRPGCRAGAYRVRSTVGGDPGQRGLRSPRPGRPRDRSRWSTCRGVSASDSGDAQVADLLVQVGPRGLGVHAVLRGRAAADGAGPSHAVTGVTSTAASSSSSAMPSDLDPQPGSAGRCASGVAVTASTAPVRSRCSASCSACTRRVDRGASTSRRSPAVAPVVGRWSPSRWPRPAPTPGPCRCARPGVGSNRTQPTFWKYSSGQACASVSLTDHQLSAVDGAGQEAHADPGRDAQRAGHHGHRGRELDAEALALAQEVGHRVAAGARRGRRWSR